MKITDANRRFKKGRAKFGSAFLILKFNINFTQSSLTQQTSF
jgi:hypothetical protein